MKRTSIAPPHRLMKALKAYRNPDFLNSPDARAIRMLSEFLEPLRRFRYHGIKDTIVFFGSARTKPLRMAKSEHQEILRRINKAKRVTSAMKRSLEQAQMGLEMARYYEDAVELAKMLTTWSKKLFYHNRFVVCSGGGPGIMEAANRGAYLARGKSIGLNISLPFEQNPNPYISEEFNFEFHYFFMRKFWFAYLGKAFVMFPGGYGTLDEVMEILTLLQTKKIKKKVTLVLYGSDYWRQIVNFDEMVRRGVIAPGDLDLFEFADTPKDAYRILTRELKKNYPDETRESKSINLRI
ncbi:MAG: TIGR00730 family Rossman fold protein [Ignavibacterium sp.]